MVEVTADEPGKVLEHGCEAQACEYPGCAVHALKDEMVQFAGGEWYCPDHGLLAASKDLLSLYRAEGDADWASISEIIGDTLPGVVAKVEAQHGRKI